MKPENPIFRSLEKNAQKITNEDANYAIHICRRFFIFLGVWPSIDPGQYSWRIIFTYISVIICYFGVVIRSIPTLLYVIIDHKNNAEKVRDIARVWFAAIGGIKYYLLRSHRRDVEMCIKTIEIDYAKIESSSHRNIMLEHARYGLMVTKICISFTLCAATWYAILPFVVRSKYSEVDDENITKIVSTRSFALPSHFGVSIVTKTPLYEIIYSSQVLATFILHSIGIACYSLAVVIVVHACGQLKILMGQLNQLVDGDDRNIINHTFNHRMANVIKNHVRILEFISSAEKLLRGICLADLGGYTLLLCAVGYSNYIEVQAESINPVAIISYTSLYITFMFNILSFCYIGELLTQECRKVGEITYMIDWYRLPAKQSLGLSLVIIMAHTPVTLTAGGAIQLSMRCFAHVVRTSLGYVNMLRTVMG